MTGHLFRPTLNLPAKKRSSGSGGAIADTKTTLQSRVLIGFSGGSTSADIGMSKGLTTTAGTSSTAKLGSNSLSFNGSQNSGFNIRINETLRLLTQFSICQWIRFNSFSFGGPWASWDANGATNGQLLFYNESGTSPSIFAFYVAYGSNVAFIAFPSGSIALNTWYHVICEVDRIDNKIRAFLNGSSQGENSIPSNFILNAGVDSFGLGGYNNSSGGVTNMNGFIDEFAILTGNTTQSERDWLYNSGSGNSLV